MKKLKFNLLTGLLLLISVSVFAAGFPPPDKVQETFQKMYPKVTTVDWQRKGDYHIADIRVDGRELNVWFSDKGKWLMTEVDVETLEAVPAAVAKAFMQSTMASMQLEDVRIITFPKQPAYVAMGRSDDQNAFVLPLSENATTPEAFQQLYQQPLNDVLAQYQLDYTIR